MKTVKTLLFAGVVLTIAPQTSSATSTYLQGTPNEGDDTMTGMTDVAREGQISDNHISGIGTMVSAALATFVQSDWYGECVVGVFREATTSV
jgi:hypothetical protein